MQRSRAVAAVLSRKLVDGEGRNSEVWKEWLLLPFLPAIAVVVCPWRPAFMETGAVRHASVKPSV